MKKFYRLHTIDDLCIIVSSWVSASLLIALFFSAPAVNILEFLLITIVLSSKSLRLRLIESLKSPLIISVLAFYGAIIIGALYSIAPPEESWGMVFGWRKLIILPFIFCAISSVKDKDFLLKTFLLTTTICLTWSYLSYIFPEVLYYKNVPGIIIKNHATQGMFFGVAIFIALIFQEKGEQTLRFKIWLYIFISLAFFNIMTITFGRSGYLVTASLIMIFTLYKVKNLKILKQFLVIGLVGIFLVGMFMSSKVSRDRIQLGITEFSQLKTEGDPGSMGVRHYWWKHSINMIQKNPIFGIGTGAFEEGLKQEIRGLSGPAAIKTNDPHNQYLKIAVEQGFIGLGIFLSILFSAFLLKNVSHPYKLIGLGVLVSWCGTSLANSHFSTFHEGHFIWFWLGAMLAKEK